MFAVKEQIPLHGTLHSLGAPSSVAAFSGACDVSLAPSFVRRQQEGQTFVYIPSCSLDGLPAGIYEIKITAKIAMSSVGGIEVYSPKVLFHSLYTSAAGYSFYTAYNHISYPFFLTTPHENFSVLLSVVSLPTHESAPSPAPHLRLQPPLDVCAPSTASEGVEDLTRKGPRFVSSLAFLGSISNVRI